MTSFWFQQLHLKDISHIVEEEDSFSSVSSQHYASQCDRFPIVSILIFSLSTPFTLVLSRGLHHMQREKHPGCCVFALLEQLDMICCASLPPVCSRDGKRQSQTSLRGFLTRVLPEARDGPVCRDLHQGQV